MPTEREIIYWLRARVHPSSEAETRRMEELVRKGQSGGAGGAANGAGATAATQQQERLARATEATAKATSAQAGALKENEERLKKVAEASAKVTDGFLMASEGALKMGRGIAVLGLVGEEDLKKLTDGLLKIQGGFDLLKGGVEVWRGLTAAANTYRASLAGVAAASAAASTVGAAGAAGGAAAAGGAGALGAVASILINPLTLTAAAVAALGAAAIYASNKIERLAAEGKDPLKDSLFGSFSGFGNRTEGVGTSLSIADALQGGAGAIGLGPLANDIDPTTGIVELRRRSRESGESLSGQDARRQSAISVRDREAARRIQDFDLERGLRAQGGDLDVQRARLGLSGAAAGLAGNAVSTQAAQGDLSVAGARQADILRRRALASRTGDVSQAPTRDEEIQANQAIIDARKQLLQLDQERFDLTKQAAQEEKAAAVDVLRTEQKGAQVQQEAAQKNLEAARAELDLRKSALEAAESAVNAAVRARESDVEKFGRSSPFEQEQLRSAARKLAAGQELSGAELSAAEGTNRFREQARQQRVRAGFAAGGGDVFGEDEVGRLENNLANAQARFGQQHGRVNQAQGQVNLTAAVTAAVTNKIEVALKTEVQVDPAQFEAAVRTQLDAINAANERAIVLLRDQMNENFARLATGKN